MLELDQTLAMIYYSSLTLEVREVSWLLEMISSPFRNTSKKVHFLASWPRPIKESKFGKEKRELELCMPVVSTGKWELWEDRKNIQKVDAKTEESVEPATMVRGGEVGVNFPPPQQTPWTWHWTSPNHGTDCVMLHKSKVCKKLNIF